MTGKYILSFSDASLKDMRLLGGKGANLGELTSVGFPVPPGFGITSTACEEFLSANSFDSLLRQMIAEVDFRVHQQVEEVTARIRDLISNAPIPDEIASRISDAYNTMKEGTPVAVRSSSMVPNLGKSSFPGQMDTFFDVVGLEDILTRVKMCWASLWTLRATVDRWNKGVDHFSVKVSALVQEMVPAEFSGVAFTVNPVTGKEEFIIEAIPGPGEALVSGRVNPDMFLLSKEPVALTKQPERSEIPDDLILQVAGMSGRIEKHYGKPQDIEWAWAGGQLYILQSRGIAMQDVEKLDYSGLERWNKKTDSAEDEVIWTRAWSDEVLTRAITPLFYSVQADLITATYDFMYQGYGLTELLPLRLMRFHKNRGYFSTRYLMECLRYVPGSLRDDEVLKFFTPAQKEEVKSLPFLALKKLASELRLLIFSRKYSFSRCHKTYYEDWRPELLQRVEDLDSLDLESAGPEQLEGYFLGMDRLIKDHCHPVGFGVMVHTAGVITFLGMALEKWHDDRAAIGVLLSGIPGNFTVETNEETWRLSRRIRESSALSDIFTRCPTTEITPKLSGIEEGRSFLEHMEQFRRKFAFRGAEDREISFRRWGDSADLLIEILKIFIQAGDEMEPQTLERNNREKRERATREIEESLSGQRWGWLKTGVFRFLLKYAQIYSLFRENQRYDIDRVFYGERKGFLAIGARLVDMGVIMEKDDIWFLSKEEVFDALYKRLSRDEVGKLIVPRKAEYRRYLNAPPPMFLQGDREFETLPEEQAGPAVAQVLNGVAASSGKATGVARVVHSMSELNRVQPGDILVTNSTDPGWTPVFLLIRGLVLETGGILAHGTVLSREYGLPAVTSVRNATRLIKDGERIAIDGSCGTISFGIGRE
jgi:pyruvate,water dikinase